MPKSGEFYTFSEVLGNLDIDEQKLKRLVSEGEIRAFREGDEMKFKKTDIDTLDVGAGAEDETREIDLAAAGEDASETLTDDLIFDEGDELDLSSDDAGMATAEITSQDTFVDEEGEPVGMSTEPLDFSDEGFDEEPEDEPEEYAGAAAPAQRRRPAARRQEAPASNIGDILIAGVLVLTIIVLFFVGTAMWTAVSGNGLNNMSGLWVKAFANDEYKIIEPTMPGYKPEGGGGGN